MAFLNLQILYLLPLVALPVIIHFLGKKKYRKVYFSDIRFIKNLEKDVIKKLRIQQILILILRTLIVLLIILAFARPYYSRKFLGVNIEKNSTLYLVIDNSNSMSTLVNNSNVLEELITRLSILSEEFEYPFYLNLIYTTEPDTILSVGKVISKQDFVDHVRGIRTTAFAGSIGRALKSVLQHIRESGELDNYVWILSDMQASNVGSLQKFRELMDELNRNKVFPVVICGDFVRHNCSVSGYVPGNSIISKNTEFELRVRLANWDAVKTQVGLTLYIENEKAGQSTVSIEPLGFAESKFRVVPSAVSYFKGYVSISNDNLPQDNRWFFALPVQDKIKVLVTGKKVEDIKFIYNALLSSDTTMIAPEFCKVEQLDYYDLATFDVLIFSNIDALRSYQIAKLKEAVKSGSKVVVFPGSDCLPDRFNGLWAEEFGFPQWIKTLAPGRSYMVLGKYDRQHSIFKGIWRKDTVVDLSGARFYKVPVFAIGKNCLPVITFADGNPFLTEVNGNGGVVGMLFAMATSDEWSDFHYRGFYPVVLFRTVAYLCGQDPRRANISAGDTIVVRPERIVNPLEFTIIKPDGGVSYFYFDKDSGELKFYETYMTGFYTVRKGSEVVYTVAVNIPQEETENRFLTEKDLFAEEGEHGVLWINVSGEKTGELFSVTSTELSPLLFIIALILIAVETYLSRINKIS